jgi:hypothetical protein
MKTYWAIFGDGNPATNSGLSPTFILFAGISGTTLLAPPGVTEMPAASGWYRFQYSPTFSINFTLDGGAGLASADRYVRGVLDPIQAVDLKIGVPEDSFGFTATDPTTVYGFLKRNQEFLEGDANFDKASGVWTIYSRGASTILRVKTLTNTVTEATKE